MEEKIEKDIYIHRRGLALKSIEKPRKYIPRAGNDMSGCRGRLLILFLLVLVEIRRTTSFSYNSNLGNLRLVTCSRERQRSRLLNSLTSTDPKWVQSTQRGVSDGQVKEEKELMLSQIENSNPSIGNTDSTSNEDSFYTMIGNVPLGDENTEEWSVSDEMTDEPKRWTTKLRKKLGLPKFSRKTLQKKGMDSLLAYGLVSNVTGCICTGIAWYLYNKKFGLSPLAPGQWPKYTAYYTSFIVMLQVIRPARLALSIYLTQFYARARTSLTLNGRMSNRRATGVLFAFNFVTAWIVLGTSVGIASVFSKVPVWSPR